MQKKKGQITIFIIIGVVLLLASVGVYFLFSTNQKGSQLQYSNIDSSDPVINHLSSCIKQTLNDATYYISLNGGYYNASNVMSESLYDQSIAYYWYNGENKMPDSSIIESEIMLYIENNVDKCLEELSIFEQQGYSLTTHELTGNTKILGDKIIAEIKFPIEVTKGEESKRYENFYIETENQLTKPLSIIKDVLDEQIKFPNDVLMGYVAHRAFEDNFTFQLINLNSDGLVLYSFMFPTNEEELIFNYLAKYNWENNDTIRLNITDVPNQQFSEDQLFYYDVDADGEELLFSDNSNYFDIDPITGEIEFYVSDFPNGEHTIIVSVRDEQGNDDFSSFKISVNLEDNIPQIEEIPDQTVNVGQEFQYQVNVRNSAGGFLFFLDDTSLFDIDITTGMIKFTPELSGSYNIKITVTNSEGTSFEYLRLEVQE